MSCAFWTYEIHLVYHEAMCLPSDRSKKVVSQVSLECEERGDMLLHLWRQMLRIFNQVFRLLRSECICVGCFTNSESSHCKFYYLRAYSGRFNFRFPGDGKR
jgi:hypothetical protein